MIGLMSFDKCMYVFTITTIKIEYIFITLKISLVPIGSQFTPLITSPGQPLIRFLFLVLPFPEWHVNGIVQCVAFCAWFLLPSIPF